MSFSPPRLFSDTRVLPSLIAASSALVIVVQLLLNSNVFRTHIYSDPTMAEEEDSAPAQELSGIRGHIFRHGGNTIFAYRVARLLGSSVLVGLSLYGLVGNRYGRVLDKQGVLEFSIFVSYLYTSFLAVVNVFGSRKWSSVASIHINLLLLSTFGVYFYRDIFPLATYTHSPLDASEGAILWIKICVLGIIGVAIPLLVPRQYTPVDPKNPMETPNPEQTAPLLSLLMYSFLDPVVFLAYKVPHLSHDQLPPLSDYDYAKQLRARSFPHIDPFAGGRKQHLFWGLMRTFRREYTMLAVMCVISALAGFVAPIGIKELLRYVETGGENATMRPWFWIAWLFVGPMIGSLAFQWYIFIATGTLVRTEGIITQLIFEHSLRIRVKAETEQSSPSASPLPSTPLIPDNEPTVSSLPSDGAEAETINSAQHQDELASSSEAIPTPSQDETLRASFSSVESSGSKKGKESSSIKGSESERDSNAANLVGKINNLVTTDLGNITGARDFLLALIYIPLQVIPLTAYESLSAFVGLASIILLFPIPGYVAKRVSDVQKGRLKATDARVQTVTESMNVLRMIKLFGWEKKMEENIAEKREKELVWIWKRQILDLINGNVNRNNARHLFDLTIIMKQELSASKVFSSMTVFDMLRGQLHMVFRSFTQIVAGKVSIDRVDDFLKNTELLDEFQKKDVNTLPQENQHDGDIGFSNANFVWSNDSEGSLTPSKRKFSLRIQDELLFKRGQINLITGPTGSGKTSLLMALLGEMHFVPSQPHSWFNLPREQGLAYAAQESWVQNETIKNNILFGDPYDEVRYKKVLHQCALERDLALFEAGDQTEVGEKGLTLSGGQKARVTLARAVYSRAEIILLDDVLAALDVHTAKWVVEKCFSGDLIQDRTVLLVTHNVAMTRPIASYVVSLAIDGTVHARGSPSEVLSNDTLLAGELAEDEASIATAESEVDLPRPTDEPKLDGKLIVAEEIALGRVGWAALQGNSLERIQAYVTIEQEPKATQQGTPPAHWPSSGEVRVENLSARYALDGPNVLHDISFHIKSGERIGVGEIVSLYIPRSKLADAPFFTVGRTGSGKSSLTLSLLRCIFTEGSVYYDGQNTKDVNLDALRSNITIIPQIPELLSGTLRQNLDPFEQHEDLTLNDALRAAGLFALQSEMDEGRLSLDSAIASGGGNLSVGQRQILALARAIVRGSKLLILDEATSAIDYKTDSIIQTSLRKELGGDVTLITIAHRLRTIMDADKIMVLDAGQIVEFDSPHELLKIDNGKLKALVDESGDKDE
ncbi:hypothetical protein H0H92_003040, partial [Tricholoma furcatifolium]